VFEVLLSICVLLAEPSKEGGLEIENAALYRSDPDRYLRTAREWTQKYAM
jgi:ubiquitin-conjugating enzyme E2 D/E